MALRTRPTIRATGEAALLFGVFVVIAGYIGLQTGLFKFSVGIEWPSFALIAAVAFIVPSLAEELVFRAGLAGRDGLLRALIAGLAFVAWHPVQVWLGLPMAQALFLDPAFLALTAGLCLVCTISYRRSGSIWPAVLIHWLTVLAWKGLTIPV